MEIFLKLCRVWITDEWGSKSMKKSKWEKSCIRRILIIFQKGKNFVIKWGKNNIIPHASKYIFILIRFVRFLIRCLGILFLGIFLSRNFHPFYITFPLEWCSFLFRQIIFLSYVMAFFFFFLDKEKKSANNNFFFCIFGMIPQK